MRDDVRAYGDVKGLSPEAFEKIKDSIPFEQVHYENRMLRVDHEGKFIDVESFVEDICELMDDDGWGAIDYIDHVEWEVTRYQLGKGGFTTKRFKPDNVLDAHQRDHGL